MSQLPPAQRSAIRRGLTWWFSPPVNPYVSVSASVNFGPAAAYLERLRASGRPVTVQHLVAGAVAQTLRAWPVANRRIIGHQQITVPHVGIGMPVNLLGHAAGARRELSATLLERAETLNLIQLGERLRGQVKEERAGNMGNPMMRGLLRWAEKAPAGLLDLGLSGLDHALKLRPLAERFYESVPLSTAITNPGSAFDDTAGMLFRAASVHIPNRIVYVGTLWGLSSVQDEVVAVDGQPVVRPMLPLLLVFDHRLFDGVVAGQVLSCFGRILKDPKAVFGPLGEDVPPIPLPGQGG